MREHERLADDAIKGKLGLLRMFSDPLPGTKAILGLMQARIAYPSTIIRADTVRSACQEALTHCPIYLVPKEESETLGKTWGSYPDSETSENDMISPSGLAYLDTPFQDPHSQEEFPIHAFGWFIFPDDHPIANQFYKEDGQYIICLILYSKTSSVTDIVDNPEEFLSPSIFPVISVSWVLGTELKGMGRLGSLSGSPAEISPFSEEFYQHQMTPYIKILQAFFAIMRQGLAEYAEHKPDRKSSGGKKLGHARKRYEGLNVSIRVVTFRKRKPGYRKPESASGRTVSVRYWRGDFWRKTYYKDEDEWRHRLIRAHRSGPEDAPEVGEHRIFIPAKPPKPIGETK